MIEFKNKKGFKKESYLYKMIALSRINNGTSIAEIESDIKTHLGLENYEICEGLKQAINQIKLKPPNFARGGVISKIPDSIFIDGGECVVPVPRKGAHPYDNDQYMFQD